MLPGASDTTIALWEQGESNCISKLWKLLLYLIFARSLDLYSEVGLSGLIAHELSHLFLPGAASETDVDRLAISWGLANEIHALRREGG